MQTQIILENGKTQRLLMESLTQERLFAEEFLLEVSLSKEPTPKAPLESGITTTTVAKRRHPKATAQNNRLLALPIDLRLQIYDELLAIPRTVHMLETTKQKSHLHNIRKFDKELFTRRGRLRYKFSSPYAGYYDPRTTTFAAQFRDDEDCTHSGLDAFVYGHCSKAAKRLNNWVWAEVQNQLCQGSEIHILELEFPKICSAICVMKFLLWDRQEGWHEPRKLSVLRIRIRSGGPLNELETMVLESLADLLSQEIQRKVLLRERPKVEIAW